MLAETLVNVSLNPSENEKPPPRRLGPGLNFDFYITGKIRLSPNARGLGESDFAAQSLVDDPS